MKSRLGPPLFWLLRAAAQAFLAVLILELWVIDLAVGPTARWLWKGWRGQ